MIIEIIDGDWYTVKLTNSNGDVSQRKFDTYPEVMAHALELLIGNHPDQKKIEDYGSV